MMHLFSIEKCPIPPNSLLEKYSINGSYVDCYFTEINGDLRFSEYVFAFYTTALFRLERYILAWAISRPSTDMQASQLANELTSTFAAWNVEQRAENEILLCDLIGRTRSWLRITPIDGARTRLYFGSAVVPVRNPVTGTLSLGWVYRSLLGFHRIYSALLLWSARRQIVHRSSVRKS